MPVFYVIDNNHYISSQLYNLLLKDNLIIDAQNGGLVLGPFHTEGGIQVIQNTPVGYRITAEMEGYEYLINANSTDFYFEELTTLNANTKPELTHFPDYSVPKHITTIKTTGNEVLLASPFSQFVINKKATEKHLDRLEDINDWVYIDIPLKSKKRWFEFWKP